MPQCDFSHYSQFNARIALNGCFNLRSKTFVYKCWKSTETGSNICWCCWKWKIQLRSPWLFFPHNKSSRCNLISVMIVRLKTTKCIDKWTIPKWGRKKNTSQGIFWGKDVLAAAAIRHVQRASVSVVKINCQEKRALQYMVFVACPLCGRKLWPTIPPVGVLLECYLIAQLMTFVLVFGFLYWALSVNKFVAQHWVNVQHVW